MGLAEESTQDMLSIMRYRQHPAKATITDCTSCIGGNVINFAKNFSRVNAIELDPRRMAFCRHNVEVFFGEKQTKVHFYNADALKQVKELQQDILFFDPPCGREQYDQNDKMDLFLSGKNMMDVCNDLKGLAKFLVLKVCILCIYACMYVCMYACMCDVCAICLNCAVIFVCHRWVWCLSIFMCVRCLIFRYNTIVSVVFCLVLGCD
jgi:hypothetical protein